MAGIPVNTTSGLLSALKTAKSGDTIYLASGTYSSVLLKNITISGNVTITSLDPNKPAVLTDLLVKNSAGLSFSNLEFAVDQAKGLYSFQTIGSSNISFDHLNVHGSMNGTPADDTSGFLIRNSSNVAVTNSEFQQQWHGISFLDSTGLTLSNNNFHDIRTDGIRGGGTSNLTISDNYLTDFYPAAGDHADGIQLWTTNTTETAKDITISGNVIARGAGAATQGVFIRDTDNSLPFNNVTVSDNTVIGGLYNGIAVNGATGLVISGNQVISYDDQKSWIRIDNAVAATLADNTASIYMVDAVSQVATAGNAVNAAVTSAVAASIGAWVAANGHDSNNLADMLRAATGAAPAVVRPAAPSPAPVATGPETVILGTSGADKLAVSGSGNVRLEGGAGDDLLTGGGKGINTLVGGLGDDTYVVRTLNDHVIELSNQGSDTVNSYVSYTLGANLETLRMMAGGLTGHGNALDNRLIGSSGNDILYGESGDDTIQGGDGNDIIHGGAGADTLRGDGGNDTLYGDGGYNKFYGGAGNDIIYGGADGNYFEGGAGADKLYGGAAADTFVFRATDFSASVSASMDDIFNFSSKQGDKISLSLIDANSKTAANDHFAFIGTNDFHKVAGELRYTVVSKDAYVMGDTNGDGMADFSIHLVGVTALNAADFIM